MANNIFPAVSLIGGGAGALDAIAGDGLVNGDGAIVITSSGSYIYSLNSTSGEAESSPDIISPDANAGDKRWILTNFEESLGFTITTAGKAILDDADAAAQRATLGVDIVGGMISYPKDMLPEAEEELSVFFPYNVSMPANLAGFVYYASVGPTAQAVVSVRKNGVEFGTMTIAIGSTSAVTLAGTETALTSSDRLSFVFPTTQDSTWAGVTIMFKVVR